jgi:hypothetical protein
MAMAADTRKNEGTEQAVGDTMQTGCGRRLHSEGEVFHWHAHQAALLS